jgi:hypothetical protein
MTSEQFKTLSQQEITTKSGIWGKLEEKWTFTPAVPLSTIKQEINEIQAKGT